jgi:hypothetical protein
LLLSGQNPALKACYPPPTMPLVNLRKAVQAALRDHATHILQWLNYIPRTNEIGRSAELIATALMLERRFNQPLIVSELGASAGLNLLFDRFALSSHGSHISPIRPR